MEDKYNKNNLSKTVVSHVFRRNLHTGDIDEFHEYKGKMFYAKPGWNKMYKNDFKEIAVQLVKHSMAYRVWLYLWDYFRKDGTIRMPLQKDIAEEVGSNPSTVSRGIKKLIKIKAIKKMNNEWRYNPYLFGIAGQSDAELYEAQRIWEEWIKL